MDKHGIKFGVNLKSPCKDCDNRTLGCHGTCEKYQDIEKQRKELKDKIKKANDLANYMLESKTKCRRV